VEPARELPERLSVEPRDLAAGLLSVVVFPAASLALLRRATPTRT
jgi:hypothetical protein